MHRRTLLAAFGLAVPSHLLLKVDDALASMPAPAGDVTLSTGASQLARARTLFDGGHHANLLTLLPQLLAGAHTVAESRMPEAYTHLAGCYGLATEALTKIGRYASARLTADRASVYAALSESPLAVASATRSLGIVLRHQDRADAAERLTLEAAAKLESSTGLRTLAERAAFAQMLCTGSYTAAQNGDRARALELIGDAERAARALPHRPVPGQSPTLTPAAVRLYEVGVHWALGDAGTAIHAGQALHPRQFHTPERRGRLHTDLARAWWQWGKPEQTAQELLLAHRAAPAEVRDRPTIRAIVTDLVRAHPRASGVRELAGALATSRRQL
ncbi:transcriptional regulator [Streptomyces sodiiphilus]